MASVPMASVPSSPASWRLTVWFVAAAALPIALLGWLVWTVAAERTRAAERRDKAVDLAAAALQRVLADVERRVVELASMPPGIPRETQQLSVGEATTFARFDRSGLVDRAGLALPYYPAVAQFDAPISHLFDVADRHEHRENDSAAAVATLLPLASASDPVLRAEALLRLARNHRNAGDVRRAEVAYHALMALDQTPVDDGPAGLVGRQGWALLLQATGRQAELEKEAATLADELAKGRWIITKGQYEHGLAQAAGWTNVVDSTEAEPERVVLADAIDVAWRAWLADRSPDSALTRTRRTFWTPSGSALIVSVGSSDRFAVLAAGRRFLESAWLAPLAAAGLNPDVQLALTDADGHLVLGGLEPPADNQAVRTALTTSLPWTLHAWSSTTLGRSMGLVLTSIAIAAAVLIAGTYVMRRAVARELAAADLQSDFVAAVSHEFRTPLTTLSQMSELLAGGRVSEARRQEFYDTLLTESRRLQRLVEGLLNFGRMEAGAIAYQLAPIDPARLVRDVVAEFQREPAAAGFTIEVDGPVHAPAIDGDQASLSRVVWNLLDNAVKYSGEARTVRVDVVQVADRVLMQVRDHGMGIPPAEQAAIFGKFIRGAAARRSSIQGTGIGLAMARTIVDAHGGTIALESAEGRGSTFSVSLPVSRAALGASESAPVAASPGARS